MLRPQVTEASALGAVILAGTGSGVYGSIAHTVTALVRTDRIFEPGPAAGAAYDESFARYRLLYPFSRSVRPA